MKTIQKITLALLTAGLFALTVAFGSNAAAPPPQLGDIFALDLNGNLFRVDAATGDRTIIGTLADPSALVRDIDFLPNGKLVATGGVGIVEIDPSTGSVLPVSTLTRGTGPFFRSLNGLAPDINGDLLVTDGRFSLTPAIFRVNMVTGNRVIVSNQTIGTGPTFAFPGLPAVAPDGSYFVPDMNLGYITQINRSTGDRSVLAVASDNNPSAMLLTPTGDYYVSFSGQNWLARFNGVSFSVVSAGPISSFGVVGSGSDFGDNVGSDDIFDIEFDPVGNLIVALRDFDPSSSHAGAIFRVNPATGDRFILSGKVGGGSLRGSGPNFQGLVSIAVVTSDSQPPVLGSYPNTTVTAGGNTSITPSAAPTDNFSIQGLTATAAGAMQSPFTGVLTVNPTTGVVTVTDAKPAGTYTVTVTAIDSAGLSSTSSFTLTVTNPVSCSPLSFTFNSVPVSSGSNATLWPFSVAVGDFNSDSQQDLAVVNQGSDNVTVLLGNGSGGFSPAAGSPIAVGDFPASVVVGDFNGDGKQDLAVANQAASNISILLGNGNGGFSPAPGSPVSAGNEPLYLVVGDFNGDGRQDLVSARDSQNVVVLLGNGSGGFSPSAGSPFFAGQSPIAVAVGDFNGDAKQDLAVANISYAYVVILLGNGSGGFTQAAGSPVRVGSGPISIVAGDFNGDGKQDLATTNQFSADITILLGNGSGGFSQAAGSPIAVTEDRLIPLTVGDFNGDGRQDLATANPNTDHLVVLLGNGSGGFSVATGSPYPTGHSPIFLVTGDFNHDGKQDVAVANNNNFDRVDVSVLLNTCVTNTPPTISSATLTRQQGNPPASATIATVSDAQDAAGALTVTATSVPVGITLTSLANSNGTVSATVGAACNVAPGNYSVALLVTDSGGLTATANLMVTVTANPAPVVTITGPASGAIYAVNTPVNFTGTFTDNAGGAHTANWMFDTTTQAATVVEPSGATPGTANTSYTFSQAGVYTVKLTVTDACGLSGTATTVGEFDALVVIYDPSAGWVTGGGWIDSPAGAYVPNPALTGKANFGFVSKYQTGASVPTGNTEFHFKAGDLRFKSTSYEWMVISGEKKAQYKGFGTLNGGGTYRFILTAIDGQQPGGGGQDKFRIKIWSDTGGLVYDNQMNDPDSHDPTTVLGGGSIVIHKP
jgi:PKD repeat protein